MSRIFKTFKALAAIAGNPWLLNRVLASPDLHRQQIRNKYNAEDGFPVLDPASLFGDKHGEKLELFSFLDGGSMATDIALLKLLACRFNDCKYFEIGTWRGESAVNLAEVTSECYTLNLSDEDLRKMNVNEKIIGLQAFFSKKNNKIIHLKGNTKDFDFSSVGKKFDLIFIDGDHHFDMVLNDTRKVFENLVHETSIVVWHDYAWNPEELRYEVMAGILEGTPSEFHRHLYHVGHTKCAVFIRENLISGKLDAPVVPQYYYQVELNYKKL